jgi:hypothetical protein
MTDESFSGYLYVHLLQPLEIFGIVVVVFAAFYWLQSSPLNSALSGWVTLADNYRVRNHPKGGRQTGAVQIGQTPGGKYRPPVMFAITKDGLYLWTYWFYSFLQPAVLVPWKDIRDSAEVFYPFTKNRYGWFLLTPQKIKIFLDEAALAQAKPYLHHLEQVSKIESAPVSVTD